MTNRDDERAANRARFPEFAAMTDSGKWKLLHARDAQGEIGKIPPLPPGCVELDFFKCMELAAMGQPKPKRGAK